jgi:hypothetical protein
MVGSDAFVLAFNKRAVKLALPNEREGVVVVKREQDIGIAEVGGGSSEMKSVPVLSRFPGCTSAAPVYKGSWNGAGTALST